MRARSSPRAIELLGCTAAASPPMGGAVMLTARSTSKRSTPSVPSHVCKRGERVWARQLLLVGLGASHVRSHVRSHATSRIRSGRTAASARQRVPPDLEAERPNALDALLAGLDAHARHGVVLLQCHVAAGHTAQQHARVSTSDSMPTCIRTAAALRQRPASGCRQSLCAPRRSGAILVFQASKREARTRRGRCRPG